MTKGWTAKRIQLVLEYPMGLKPEYDEIVAGDFTVMSIVWNKLGPKSTG